MDIHNLNCIFNPQRIALIGITPNSKIVGGKIYSNLVGGSFREVAQTTPDNPWVIYDLKETDSRSNLIPPVPWWRW
ncbi:MAG TPA: hypothetical protein VF369_03195 [candidate division Zixibacteria bacterium]